ACERDGPQKTAGRESEIKGGLSRCCEGSDRFDADHGRDRGDLEPPPGFAKMLLDGRDIEPAGNLLSDPYGEVLASGLEQPAALYFVLKRPAFGFGAFEDGVGMAERIGQRFVRKIMETRCDRRIDSLSHWSLLWLGLGLPRCYEHLGGPT